MNRTNINIVRDTSRVITRFHIPSIDRIPRVIERVFRLSNAEAEAVLENTFLDFSDRHKDLKQILEQNFQKVSEFLSSDTRVSAAKKLLIGAYFTMEYAVESAALFNPSIVPHPDQTDVPAGGLRFIMSLRATGEGHLSSIVFRGGIIDNNTTISFLPTSEFVETPEVQVDSLYDRHLFRRKLHEMNVSEETTNYVFEQLSEEFTRKELNERIGFILSERKRTIHKEAIEHINWLADSNYKIKFHDDHLLSERVIFPVSENETSGIEDARFVQFFEDNGEISYYATYTAYNGENILPQLIETKDFITFNIVTLNGEAVQNKGMALFPRKINGRYAMLSRQDGENNYIMYSDHLHFWEDPQLIQEPTYPWEFVQIGNCGSPLEINEGWLVLTHGVGPMRQYYIGAILLDLKDPSKIIGRLKQPLLTPNDDEREGYVPNVVYSCGALIHNNELILPYAMSDITSGIATAGIDDIVALME
ncbi:MAG: glycoside hydrolase family 130 protein [Spirochaetales bacterium]|nr:glycoside hydrolase family 130 protein [Spirochaetales bacterium]MCF7938233.1 glycoside hydrolase family 130 protein [Spirochaetales bacterium]